MIVLLFAATALPAAGLKEYSASYSLFRNGKLAGQAEMKLERRGDKWIMTSTGSGTHGLAKFLRARDREYVEGFLEGHRFKPQRFEHSAAVAGIGSEWQAEFDWPNDSVTVKLDKKSVELNLQGEALDGLSLKMEMQRRLRAGDDNLQFLLVDEDEIEEQTYRPLPTAMLETNLGCLETIPVERVRSAESTRYTRAWHAPALDYRVVKLEHGKTDGDQMEMRIDTLQQANLQITTAKGCSEMNSG